MKKKRAPTFSERLGLAIPDPKGRRVIWIHAISVGETKAAQPLFERLKADHPEAFFLVTHTTATGRQEAKRSLSSADAFAYMPLDFPWIMNRWAKTLRPSHFLLIEGDFWFNQLQALKRQGTKIILASGKISERSASRFSKIPFFSKQLFGVFDLFCVQSDEYATRFAPFVKSSVVTGNLKFDVKPQSLSPPASLHRYQKPMITLGSTHALEEKFLLAALKPFFAHYTILLAPRHPERLEEVKKLLQSQGISYSLWSELERASGEETVILVDLMGQLSICYAISQLAFVAGSFVDGVGGHNMLEPCLYGCPSLFGPYTYTQKELVSYVLQARAGMQLDVSQVASVIEGYLQDPISLTAMRASALALSKGTGKVSETTCFLMKEKSIWK
ncbi:MAG: glycosyltransferase N-terminal domain-containing protein [Chlamydiales bacterium]|nr:glycosyltransferase N-terminal domain-containing protein [Chlamydiales bacterium]